MKKKKLPPLFGCWRKKTSIAHGSIGEKVMLLLYTSTFFQSEKKIAERGAHVSIFSQQKHIQSIDCNLICIS
jgi:hypothetical protein